MDNQNWNLDDEVYKEIDFIPEHKTFPVKLKIVKREKHKPFFDLEDIPEDFEEL